MDAFFADGKSFSFPWALTFLALPVVVFFGAGVDSVFISASAKVRLGRVMIGNELWVSCNVLPNL